MGWERSIHGKSRRARSRSEYQDWTTQSSCERAVECIDASVLNYSGGSYNALAPASGVSPNWDWIRPLVRYIVEKNIYLPERRSYFVIIEVS